MDEVITWASRNGHQVGFAPLEALEAARDAVASRREMIEPTLFADMFHYFVLTEYKWDWRPTAVIVVATARPGHIVTFETESGKIQTIVPPSLVNYKAVTRANGEGIRQALGGEWRVEEVFAPLKSLAARAGLVEYGRNNITYTRQFGSYQLLSAFVTDAPVPESFHLTIHEPVQMAECEECDKCREICPTGAIGGDRFLLHAERCLTALQGDDGDWPDYVPRKAHNALTGCMKCQEVCPRNKGLLRLERVSEEFTKEETAALLAGTEKADPFIWQAVKDKFSAIGLAGYVVSSGRNLKALMEARGL